MKIIILTMASVFLVSLTAFAAMKYQCYSYLKGKPHKMIHVTADNNNQAVALACERFKQLGISFDSVKCK